MDVSEKEDFTAQKRNGDTTLNYDSVDNNTDWRVSAPIDSYPPHSLISSCPSSSSASQMMDSFGQTLWYDPTNVQPVSYGGFNANASSFRANIDRSLEMNWNGPNLLPKSNGIFLPNPSSFLPPSIAQFPADSGFIERAARFSLFSSGNFSDMVNQPLGNPDSIGLFLQSGAQGMQIRSGTELVQCPSNELTPNDASTTGKDCFKKEMGIGSQPKPNVPGSGNVSEDTQSSGGNERRVKGGETSSKGFNTRKRKRQGQDSEAGQSHRSQQSGEEPDSNGDEKKTDEQSPNSPANKTNSGKKQTSDPPKDGYIHVRARRGQATNSHSLAERVRREKISERMKFLQDLVPGCNKVTGKAVMLDEIINYVQSLQRQVEFLSMKLATVNPQMDFNLEGLLTKDATLQLRPGPSSGPQFPQNVSVVYPSLPHGFMQQTLSSIGDPSVSPPLSQPMNGGFKRQETHGGGWEGDLQNVIHMNYGSGDVTPDPQAATAAANTNMKVEP